MKPEEIKSWDVKPWPLESSYESLSNVAKVASWYLSDTCLCVSGVLKNKYYGDDEIVSVANSLSYVSEHADGNTSFPDFTDYFDDMLEWLKGDIKTLKAANKGYELSKLVSELEFAYKAGKQAVLFDRSRWLNDIKEEKRHGDAI